MVVDKSNKMSNKIIKKRKINTSSKTTILDLNSDCMLEVFKYLDLKDLCATGDVCRHFRENAQNYFALPKFKKDILEIVCAPYPQLVMSRRDNFSVEKMRVIELEGMSFNKKLLHISRVLRIFGVSVRSIKLYEGRRCDGDNLPKCNRFILNLIGRYCSGTLIELDLYQCDLTGEIEKTMRPLLLHLERLIICECKYSKLFGQMLSMWSPELRGLQFSYDLSHLNYDQKFSKGMRLDDILCRSFPKLTWISFRSICGKKTYNIEKFLKLNPQLKKIGLVNCSSIRGNIFQSIATHVPHIEAMEIDRVFKFNDSNLKYCGQFNCLNTLKLCTMGYKKCRPLDHAFIPSILHEIHVAKIALKHLHVYAAKNIDDKNFERTEEVIDAILKLKTLESLWLLQVPELRTSHILDICKQLSELSNLKLECNELMMSEEVLLEIVKTAHKLQSLQYFDFKYIFDLHTIVAISNVHGARKSEDYCKLYMKLDPRSELPDSVRIENGEKMFVDALPEICGSDDGQFSDNVRRVKAIYEEFKKEILSVAIDQPCIDAYLKIVQIVEKRREKRRLLIELDPFNPILAVIPKDLIRENDDILKLVGVESWCSFFFNEVDS